MPASTIDQLVREQAEARGDHVLLAEPSGELSFRELERASHQLATDLAANGVTKSTSVGLLVPNSRAWVTAWVALSRLGAVVVPISTFTRSLDLPALLRHADVHTLLAVSRFAGNEYLTGLTNAVLDSTDAMVLPELPCLRHVWTLDYGAMEKVPPGRLLPALPPASTTQPWAEVVASLASEVTESDPSLVVYSSGSSGSPKGIVHSQGALIRHARATATMTGLGANDVLWTPMPFFWIGGLVYALLRTMITGGTVLTQSQFTVDQAVSLMERYGVTEVAAWPASNPALLSHPRLAAGPLPTLSRGTFIEGMPSKNRPVSGSAIGSFGMTETCGPHTLPTIDDIRMGAPRGYEGALGRPVPGIEHRIVGSDGQDLSEGQVGELLVRGPNTMLGIHKRSRHEVFDAEGWYRTGDLTCIRGGFLFFVGRTDNVIKSAGVNIAPEEVEAALMQLPEVRLAWVVGVPDPVRDEEVVAVLVPAQHPAAALDTESVLRALKARLEPYKVPRRLLMMADNEVPRLPSQKVDRRALRDGVMERLAAQAYHIDR